MFAPAVASDGPLHDFRRAFIDGGDAHITFNLFYHVFFGIAVATERLNGIFGGFVARFRTQVLGDGSFRLETVFTCVQSFGYPLNVGSRRLQACRIRHNQLVCIALFMVERIAGLPARVGGRVEDVHHEPRQLEQHGVAAEAAQAIVGIEPLLGAAGVTTALFLIAAVISTTSNNGAAAVILAPVAYEVVRSRRQALAALEPEVVNGLMLDMHAEAMAVVRQGVGPSAADEDLRETRHAYMRYVGQGHEILVPLPLGPYDDSHGEVFRRRFETAYRQLYGRTIEGVAIEALSWTLTITAEKKGTDPFLPAEKAADAEQAQAKRGLSPSSEPASIGHQALFDPATCQPVEALVYLRGDLPPGATVSGPALITEEQTTTVVPPAWQGVIDDHGGIVLTRREAADE